jgi:hypothetical protein
LDAVAIEVVALAMMIEVALIAIQILQLAFLATHDWITLGPLNDLAGIRSQNTTRELIVVTLIGALPVAMALTLTLLYYGKPLPLAAAVWIWGTYVLLLLGAIRAWWVPYLVREDSARAERFRIMFGNTHTFLPQRNGMAPNTLHVAFHFSLLITLALFAARN